MVYLLENDFKELRKILIKKPVELAFLFGFRIQGNLTKFSDYDIAILISETYYQQNLNNFKTLFKLKLDFLEELFNFVHSEDVDLVILNEAPPHLKYKIIQRGQIIYYNNLNTYYRFKAKIILEFLDFSSVFNFYREALYKKLVLPYA